MMRRRSMLMAAVANLFLTVPAAATLSAADVRRITRQLKESMPLVRIAPYRSWQFVTLGINGVAYILPIDRPVRVQPEALEILKVSSLKVEVLS